ncbi:hypothetical protein CVT25_005641 [Psilocybe cyanescens]|uniref:Uncharacterized protein n=1 Tax=Psilocybe cyanescens TaxID=93625 RepID=A0A409X6H1_PSICY|nr:hypothetical protein CVT25_005641 [Psilocybe cyanescens]
MPWYEGGLEGIENTEPLADILHRLKQQPSSGSTLTLDSNVPFILMDAFNAVDITSIESIKSTMPSDGERNGSGGNAYCVIA